MTTARVDAACLCGAVRIQIDLPFEKAGHCHCSNCRRAHGAAFWTWVTVARERLHVVAGADALRTFTVPEGSVRSFCGACGTTLLYESPRWPGKLDVSVANLEDAAGVVPGGHAYADRAPAWAPIHDDLPRYGGPDGVQRL